MGDSLNRLRPRDGGLRRTVRIPVNKRHVFSSKERTPVLLLAETLAVGNDGNAEGGEGEEEEEEESNGGRKRCNSGVISSPSAQGNEMSALGSLIRRSSRDYGYESLSVPAPRAGGMKSSNLVARAAAARRAAQAMESRRVLVLINESAVRVAEADGRSSSAAGNTGGASLQ